MEFRYTNQPINQLDKTVSFNFLITQLTAFLVASTGPIPMKAGSTPACAQDTIRHNGCKDLFLASSALINTQTADPSFKPVNLRSTHRLKPQ